MRCRYSCYDEIHAKNLEVLEHIRGAGIKLIYVKCVFTTECCGSLVTGTLW